MNAPKENPHRAEQPGRTDLSDAPNVPDRPSVPNAPNVPDRPDVPDAPNVPDRPSVPNLPDVPDFPECPDCPTCPNCPGSSVRSAESGASASEARVPAPVTAAGRHLLHRMAIENLTVIRGGSTLIEGVSFHIHCGDMVALVGPNGGGKSTLLKAIIGEIPHTGGVRYGDAAGQSVLRPRIGYMPQYMLFDRLSPLTVADLLAAARARRPVFLGLSRSRRQHVQRLLEQVEAGHLIDRRLGDLSGGELQRVSLAFALDPVPDVLLLDEPVAALDKTGRALFYKLVQDLRDRFDLLTLIVTHDLGVIHQYATHAYYLDRTIRAGGPVGRLLSNPETASWFSALSEEI